MSNGPHTNKNALWLYGLAIVTIVVAGTGALVGTHQGKAPDWSDGKRIAVFLGLLAVVNCVLLLIRVRIIERESLSWTNLEDFNVAMAVTSLCSILLWSGMALWLVHEQMCVDRAVCYSVAAIGALGHGMLHFNRFLKSSRISSAIAMFIYGTILLSLTIALISGYDFIKAA